MEPLHCPVSAPIAGTEQHQTPVESFDGQICVRAAEVGDHRRVNRRFPNNRMGRWTLELQDGAAGNLLFHMSGATVLSSSCSVASRVFEVRVGLANGVPDAARSQ